MSNFELNWEDDYKLSGEEWGNLCAEIAERYKALRVAITIEHYHGGRLTIEHDEALKERANRPEWD